jgi:hypothetical protein
MMEKLVQRIGQSASIPTALPSKPRSGGHVIHVTPPLRSPLSLISADHSSGHGGF